MKLIVKILALIAGNALALWIATLLIEGFTFADPSILNFMKIGLVLGLVNAFIKPIIKLISLPIRLLTLGLFTVIINIGLLFLVSLFFDTFSIEGLSAALWGTVVISLVNYIVSLFFRED